MDPYNEETRQFRREPGPAEPARNQRPRQYFPETGEQPVYQEPAYQEPAYQEYQQPRYEQYQEPVGGGTGSSNNSAAIALGVIAGLATLAAVVFMFLWRGAAEEANQPPETVTVTQTQTATSTVTTTRRPSLFPDRGASSTPELPSELPSELPTEVPTQVQDEVGGLIDDLLNEADRALQGR